MGTLSVDNIEERSTGNSQNVLSGQAKAWSNLNGTGTIAERDSFNVSSFDDNGTGSYDTNFSNSFADANWSMGNCVGDNSNTFISMNTPTAGAASYYVRNTSNTPTDEEYITHLNCGDLA